MVHILYNPKSNCAVDISTPLKKAQEHFKNQEVKTQNLLEIESMRAYFDTLENDDEVVLLGGDGTINVFCNKLIGYEIKNKIYMFKAGSGNDFIRDVAQSDFENTYLVQINEYIENLPVVTVNSKEYLFVNNVGFGIDGRVCTAAEEEKEKGKESINYTTLAIKLLLTQYKPNGATVTVDGKKRHYKRVWMAPVMNGRYYGGGMMPCPKQDRKGDVLSLCVVHSTNALQTLMIFPSIFKGEHIKHTKKVEVLSGKEIKVEFDSPRDVQIDGETIRGITEISAVKYSSLSQRDEKFAKATV
ncbi:MAG: diacylglycerol kinase family protein [Ruminococcus sp.]|nr:diacylglycerol kinase family protein [Ruminococcus sp.]